MKVILLERLGKIGQIGDEVSVKDGFARNYLLPQGKALRANKDNRAYFESQRAEIEKRNAEAMSGAEEIGNAIEGKKIVMIRSAGDMGQLYGSVSSRDIASALGEDGFSVTRNQVVLNQPIKTIGLHDVMVQLHAEVQTSVVVNVARSEDEAERQAAGEDLRVISFDDEDNSDSSSVSDGEEAETEADDNADEATESAEDTQEETA